MASSIGIGQRKVAVLGATGAIGQVHTTPNTEVVKLALAHPSINSVVAIVRRAGSVTPHAKLTETVVQFDDLSSAAFEGCQIVYCCLGSTIKAAGSQEEFKKQDHDLIIRCAEKAKEAGATEFSLVSSVGADSKSGNFYLRTKGQIEDRLRELNFERAAVWKPSVLEAKRPTFRCGECCGIFCARWVCGPCIYCCCRQYSAIRVEEVAQGMVAESLRPGDAGVIVFDGSGQIFDFLKALPNEETRLLAPPPRAEMS